MSGQIWNPWSSLVQVTIENEFWNSRVVLRLKRRKTIANNFAFPPPLGDGAKIRQDNQAMLHQVVGILAYWEEKTFSSNVKVSLWIIINIVSLSFSSLSEQMVCSSVHRWGTLSLRRNLAENPRDPVDQNTTRETISYQQGKRSRINLKAIKTIPK